MSEPIRHTEISKRKAQLYAQLGRKKIREREGLFMAEGAKCVNDLFGWFRPECLVVDPTTAEGSEWLERFDQDPTRKGLESVKEIEIVTADTALMSKISQLSTPPSVAGVFHLPNEAGASLQVPSDALCLMLDGVQDPGNFGTIIRTAHWFGVTRIFASRDSADIYNPKTIQATMGSLGRVEVVYCRLRDVIEANPGVEVYGTLLEGSDIYDAPLGIGGLVVMGNEGRGISPELRSQLTHALYIPPYDESSHGESLNVAAATAVVLSQFRSRTCAHLCTITHPTKPSP